MVLREYTQAEKLAYVEEFKASGMSQKRFAKEKGIPDTTFRGWLKSDRALEFGEICLKPPATNYEPKEPVRKTMVFAREDIRIELREGFDKQFLRKIVEVLINDN